MYVRTLNLFKYKTASENNLMSLNKIDKMQHYVYLAHLYYI